MGIFDAISSWRSSVINTVSSWGSSVISNVGNYVRTTANNIGTTVSTAVTQATKAAQTAAQQASKAAEQAGKAAQQAAEQASKAAEQAGRAAQQAAEQASKAASNAVSGLTSGFAGLIGGITEGITGSTYTLISDAQKNIENAQKAIDDAVKAGGDVSSSVYKQLEQAREQVANTQRQIKTQIDNTGKDIVKRATAAAAAATPVDIAKTALLLNPLTMPFAGAAMGSTALLNQLTGGSKTVSSSDTGQSGSVNPITLDYGNKNVVFYNQDGSDAGYLGQNAIPYAVTDRYLLFDTGKDNVQSGLSSWTNTPDSGKLTKYGLGSNYASLSNAVYGQDLTNMLEIYDNHGWTPKNTVKEQLDKYAVTQTSAASPVAAVTGGNWWDNIVNTVGGWIGGGGSSPLAEKAATTTTVTPIEKATASGNGNIIDQVIKTRDDAYVSGITNIATGDPVMGIATTGAAVAADWLLPLDAVNVANKLATGQEITQDEWFAAGIDAALIVAGALTGGTAYLAVKGAKTLVKGVGATRKTAKVGGTIKALDKIENPAKALTKAEEKGSGALKASAKGVIYPAIGGAVALGTAAYLTDLVPEYDDTPTHDPTYTTETTDPTGDGGDLFDQDKFTEDVIKAILGDGTDGTTTPTTPGTDGGADDTDLGGLGDALSRFIYSLGGGGGSTSITYSTGSGIPVSTNNRSDYLLPIVGLGVVGLLAAFVIGNNKKTRSTA
ncbi:hypothetical protein McpSp1_09010 [Methanocorpusculaceae archaeon Sp1]|nr:hypothetical protein [Methanocorpusculaceae archaeon Sp1]